MVLLVLKGDGSVMGALPPLPLLALVTAWPLKGRSVSSSARSDHPFPLLLF